MGRPTAVVGPRVAARRRGLLLVAVTSLVLGVYAGVVPLLWPDPAVDVHVPAVSSSREGLPVAVTVTSWHDNVRVLSVRLYVDPTRSEVMVPASTVVVAAPEGEWSFAALDRLTYPRRSRVDVNLPISSPTAGSAVAGVLRGTIDVEIELARPRRRGMHLLLGYPAWRERHRTPVELRITP